MMDRVDIWLRVTGEPFLGLCRAFKEQRAAHYEGCRLLAAKYGCPGFQVWNGEAFAGLNVPAGGIPDGWKRGRARRGSQPFLSPASAATKKEVAALPPFPSLREIEAATGIPLSISYKLDGGGRGARSVGYPFAAVSLGWIGETFYLRAPDFNAELAAEKKRHPDAKITPDEPWVCPDGLQVITKAEYEFEMARYNLEQERAA